MAQSQWYYIVHKDTECEVRVLGDGTVQAFSSAQDIGTGTRTVFAQVVAEEFGLRAEDIDARIGDSLYPAGPPSGGSRVTSSLTPAARNAAYRAARELAKHLAPLLDCKADLLAYGPGSSRFPQLVAGFRPEENDQRRSIEQALGSAGIKVEKLDKVWPEFVRTMR